MRARWSLEPRQGTLKKRTAKKRQQAGTDVQNRRKTGSQNNKGAARTVAAGAQPIVSAGIATPPPTAAAQPKTRETSVEIELKPDDPARGAARPAGPLLYHT